MNITKCRPDDRVTITQMPEDNTLFSLGLLPGRAVKVEHVYPLRGPIVVSINGRSLAIGWALADRIEVQHEKK